MTSFALSIGANLDDREAALRGAVEALSATQGVSVTRVSSVYETDPVGGPDQPDYFNAVVVGTTTLSPDALLHTVQQIEDQWHRTRAVRWGPRTLDIDIITMGGASVDSGTLTVPHPRAAERAFVCVPLLEADPDAHIGTRPVVALIRELATDGVRIRRDIDLRIPEAQ